jgi:hypothetical protein
VSLLNRLSVRSAEPRRAAVFTAFFVLLALILCGYAITGNLRGAWRGIGVPSMAPAFADLRSVTHSIDCVEQGRDPYVDWGCDPWGRPFNQPPVWLALGKLGINSSWTNVLGFSLILAVFASFYLLLGTRTLLSGILAFAAMLSPSILLGLERGNGDLVVFTLLALGMHALLRSPAAVRLPLVSILIASLTVLKFFPVAATLALARGWRGWATATAVAVFSVSVFIVAVDGHLHQIFMNTPQSFYLSFGSGTLFFRAANMLGVPNDQLLAFRIAGSGLAAGLGLSIFVLIWLGRLDRVIDALPHVELGQPADDLAIACAATFCFVFLLGTSWDYRLILLIGVLPIGLRTYDDSLNWKDTFFPVMIVAFLWIGRVPKLLPEIWPIIEVLNWMLFASLAALVASATRIQNARSVTGSSTKNGIGYIAGKMP